MKADQYGFPEALSAAVMDALNAHQLRPQTNPYVTRQCRCGATVGKMMAAHQHAMVMRALAYHTNLTAAVTADERMPSPSAYRYSLEEAHTQAARRTAVTGGELVYKVAVIRSPGWASVEPGQDVELVPKPLPGGDGIKRGVNCGTNAGWAAHQRALEEPCNPCREAHNEYMRNYRKDRP